MKGKSARNEKFLYDSYRFLQNINETRLKRFVSFVSRKLAFHVIVPAALKTTVLQVT